MKEALTSYNSLPLIAIVVAAINGVVLPLAVAYLKKIAASLDKVEKMDASMEAFASTLDRLVGKVETLLTESTISKEQLSYVNKEIDEIKNKLQKVSTYATSLELRLKELESKLEHHKERHQNDHLSRPH